MTQIASINGGYTVIGQGSVLEGELKMNHSLRIEGTLKGRLITSQSLVVGPHWEVEAELIEVGEARISGRVSGKLRASQRVYVSASAVFRGTIETPRLVIEEGAVFVEMPAAK